MGCLYVQKIKIQTLTLLSLQPPSSLLCFNNNKPLLSMASNQLVSSSSLNLSNMKLTQKDVSKHPELKQLWNQKSKEEGKIRTKMNLLKSIPLATEDILSNKNLSDILVAPNGQVSIDQHAYEVLKVLFFFHSYSSNLIIYLGTWKGNRQNGLFVFQTQLQHALFCPSWG